MPYAADNNYPAGTPMATIYLHGLLGMCFKDDTSCTIGINNKSSMHTPRFEVWESNTTDPDNPTCTLLHRSSPAKTDRIAIKVTNPTKQKVHVYGPSPVMPPVDRDSFVNYCLDMEGAKFHTGPLAKDRDAWGPRFTLSDGFFSTSQKTVCLFKLEKGTDVKILNNIAVVIVADIFVDTSGQIEFTGGAGSYPILSPKSGVAYEILITNHCTDSTRCHFNPAGPTAAERNDFYCYYDALDKKVLVEPCELINMTPDLPGDAIRLGHCGNPAGKGRPLLFSDPAPCAPVCFGMSDNFP